MKKVSLADVYENEDLLMAYIFQRVRPKVDFYMDFRGQPMPRSILLWIFVHFTNKKRISVLKKEYEDYKSALLDKLSENNPY